ncbi:MAG TPA: type II toxin-antitoxin system RelE/ParE family toxin [Chloroflexota bacterium]|nr:type II toxin-antitoxin system RelE/ParE family toxin [Chloroflexota bacterium]
MTIIWTPRARKHLLSISAYIARDSPTAARQTVDRIRDAVGHLAEHPAMGRPGRIEGTRELVITGTRYIVAYRVRKDALRILAIIHSSQRWPDKL